MDASSTFNATSDDSGKRERPRDSMLLQGVLRPRGGADEPVSTFKVRNISAGGLMGQSDAPVAVHDDIAIELRNIGLVRGKVVWVNGDRFGVTFDQPINPQLARQKRQVSNNPGPQLDSSGFRKITHPLG